MNLDNWNYYSDSRVIASMTSRAYRVVESGPSESVIELDEVFFDPYMWGDSEADLPELGEGVDFETRRVKVRLHYEVCTLCRGSGKTVNPSIDAGGISGEDFDRDPDFAEAYFSGHYDITCPECDGQRVIPVLNLEEPLKSVIEEYERDAAANARERAAELRYGC